MNMIYLELDGLLAIPILNITGIRWSEVTHILSIYVGTECHKMICDKVGHGSEMYDRITQQVEEFYNL